MSSKSGSPARLVAVIGLLLFAVQYYMGEGSYLHGVWRALVDLPATALGNLR